RRRRDQHRQRGDVHPVATDMVGVPERVEASLWVEVFGPVTDVGIEGVLVLHRGERRELAAGVGAERAAWVVGQRQQPVHREQQHQRAEHHGGARGPRGGWARQRGDRRDRGHSSLRVRTTRSRGIDAAAPYSGARATKPGAGGGSSMWSASSPRSAITLMYRPSGRCMKGNLTPGAT